MTIHVLVEGPSEKAFIDRWASRLIKSESVTVHPHEGKGSLPADTSAPPPRDRRGLLEQLPAKLRGYAQAPDAADKHIVVLVDADDDDPQELSAKIEAMAKAVAPALRVTVRLAIEETEAFYLGDLKALETAYPDADLARARAYQPDSVCGTWELFGRIIGDGGGNKVDWAETMGPHLTTQAARSRSPSFQGLIDGLTSSANAPTKPVRKRKYRHPPRERTDPGRRR
jgi:hypothetical protein